MYVSLNCQAKCSVEVLFLSRQKVLCYLWWCLQLLWLEVRVLHPYTIHLTLVVRFPKFRLWCTVYHCLEP